MNIMIFFTEHQIRNFIEHIQKIMMDISIGIIQIDKVENKLLINYV